MTSTSEKKTVWYIQECLWIHFIPIHSILVHYIPFQFIPFQSNSFHVLRNALYLHVNILVWDFLYILTSFMRAANALASLHYCTVSPDHSLLDNPIILCTNILCFESKISRVQCTFSKPHRLKASPTCRSCGSNVEQGCSLEPPSTPPPSVLKYSIKMK